jgi:hypothetical protein
VGRPGGDAVAPPSGGGGGEVVRLRGFEVASVSANTACALHAGTQRTHSGGGGEAVRLHQSV